ncbi:uncharacterized protein LOC115022270 [Cottoperca gobio]|uniref:Uncharacterized protein LOC115022270 n=1 Tax=Cottoperca gobio TaxID=56716 RepID=A0A6J2RI16_COTGO|nr:uncharacterized protein LOC115022270 [Cottoperca gobio]
MLSLHHCVSSLMFLLLLKGVSCEELTADKKEEYSLEGSSVTLSYKYSKLSSSDNFFWYRQYPGKPPEFIFSHLGSGVKLNDQISGLSVEVSEDKTRILMQISSAAVTHSAVYYCAKDSGEVPADSSFSRTFLDDDDLKHQVNESRESGGIRGSQEVAGGQLGSRGTGGALGVCRGPAAAGTGVCSGPAAERTEICRGGSVTERSENTDLRGDGEIQGGAQMLLNCRRERNFYIQQSSTYKPSTLPSFNMLSLHHCVSSLMFLLLLKGVCGEELTADKKEEYSLEGSSVTLSYRYSKLSSSDYFFWYRQYPAKPPEFIISHSASGAVGNYQIPGLKIEVAQKQILMQISSAAVTDSAVYYCAVRPTVTGNTRSLYKNLWSKDNTILHNFHQRESLC